MISTFKNGELLRVAGPFKNKVVSGAGGYGRNLLMRQIAGDTTYPIVINSMSIGSGSTAPADSDTGLATLVTSGIPLTALVVTNDQLQIDVFMADGSLANGTYRELGFFATARLFSRILLSTAYTKASGEDTLFSYTVTLAG